MSYVPQPYLPANSASDLFAGIVIHINGYTRIDRVVLIKLITANGGTVCRVPRKKVTTYVLSDQDNFTSKDGFRVIHSSWVTDCIERRTLLPFDYDSGDVDCRHPNFIKEYYSKSRLHFISMEKLQLRSRYLKIAPKNSGKVRLIYYIDFDSFFASGSVLKHNRLFRYSPIDIKKDCVVVSNGSSHSEITSINYVAKHTIGISRNDYFETSKTKYERYVKENPQVEMKFHCLKVEFEEYRAILTQFYDLIGNEFDTVIPMSVDEGMFFDYLDENEINYDKIAKKVTLLKLKIKAATGTDVSISVTRDFLFLNKIILTRVKPDGIGICLTEEDVNKELETLRICDVPGSGRFIFTQLHQIVPSGKYNTELTVKDLKVLADTEYTGGGSAQFLQLLDDKTKSNVLFQKFLKNIVFLQDDEILHRNKTGDTEYYIPNTVSCTINYHMSFTTLWEINGFVKRFTKYLVSRLETITNFYESVKQVGVVVVMALEGNVVSKFGGMGNKVKRLSRSLTYDSYVKIDSNKCLEKLGNDFFKLIKSLVNKDKINDIKGISLQVLKFKTVTSNAVSHLPFTTILRTPDNKESLSPTKRVSTHSKETLVKLIDNEDKETLKALPLDVLQDIYFEQKFDFKSRSAKRNIEPSNSNSLKKIKSTNSSPAVIIAGDVRNSLNKDRLNVFEPISFQAEKSISAIKQLLKKWVRYTIANGISPTDDDKQLFLNFLKNLKENGQQSRLDNIAQFTNNYLQQYQHDDDLTGVIGDWERFMILKVLPMMA